MSFAFNNIVICFNLRGEKDLGSILRKAGNVCKWALTMTIFQNMDSQLFDFSVMMSTWEAQPEAMEPKSRFRSNSISQRNKYISQKRLVLFNYKPILTCRIVYFLKKIKSDKWKVSALWLVSLFIIAWWILKLTVLCCACTVKVLTQALASPS